MKHLPQFTLATVVATLVGVGAAVAQDTAQAELKNAEGNSVGTVSLRETPAGVLLTAKLKGLPQGVHAFHVHAVGKCEPPFTSAGGHFDATDAKHGFLVEGGPHDGDMPNIYVPNGGNLEIEILNERLELEALLDADGAAIVVHAGADDYKSQPSGAAGDRIACGVISK